KHLRTIAKQPQPTANPPAGESASPKPGAPSTLQLGPRSTRGVALVLPAPTPTIAPATPASSGKVRQRVAVVPLRLLDGAARDPHAAVAPSAAPTPQPTEPPSPTPVPTQTPLPESAMAEARDYLIGVSRDLGFTRVLPAGDPSTSSAELARRLNALQRARG